MYDLALLGGVLVVSVNSNILRALPLFFSEHQYPCKRIYHYAYTIGAWIVPQDTGWFRTTPSICKFI